MLGPGVVRRSGELGEHLSPAAWTGEGNAQAWSHDVLLEVDGNGYWSSVTTGVTREQAQVRGAEIIAGPLLPGVINAHSHAFQRAIAGLTERSGGRDDDFWSWRDRM